MNGIAERNKSGRYYVNTRLGVVKTKCSKDFEKFNDESDVAQILTDLIEVNAKGFRGVVVTALTGLYLNENYDPLNDFYGCNPRSIFEGGIWSALQENGIPCGKSDPLNVAKNISQLDEGWAKGRRPQAAALAAVTFLRIVMASAGVERAELVDYFFFRLWKYAEDIASYPMVAVGLGSESKHVLGQRLVDFTLSYPESGHLPQLLVAELLEAVFFCSKTQVKGGGESVFGTNTTSKKPADIWLELDGRISNLYEITVKPVSEKRLDDSIDALHATGHLQYPVTFVCRLARDVATLDLENGSCVYKGKRFDFLDYAGFCCSLTLLLSEAAFSVVLKRIAAFVRDQHTSLKTKEGWNRFFG